MRTALLCLAALAFPAFSYAQTTGLAGDPTGLRTQAASHGVTLSLTDSENLLSNLAGGEKTGATNQGLSVATLSIDTGKAFNLQGGTINISAEQIHGRALSQYYLNNLQTANGNEAQNSTRLWEAWYDQAFGVSDVKIGQQSIDNEFIVSQYSALFINTMAGWPLLPSDDLYAGGPAYPLSSLGARLKTSLAPNVTVLAGAFDDNPPGGSFANDPQSADSGGTKFNLQTGALFIAEVQYVRNPAPASGPATGLTGTYKLGFWYDTAAFPDQEFGTDSLSLANPASSLIPQKHRGNYSLYAVMDQTLWQNAGGQSVNGFARIMFTPLADENLIVFFFNGGLTIAAPFPSRPNDSAGIDFGLGDISGRAAALSRDTAFFTGTPLPARTTEELIELTYQAQITPWLLLQPDVQYIITPGAGILNNNPSLGRVQNEFVAGLRAITTF